MSSIARTQIAFVIVFFATAGVAVQTANAGKLSRARQKTDEKEKRESRPEPKAQSKSRSVRKQASRRETTSSKSSARASSSKSSAWTPSISVSSNNNSRQSAVASVRSKPQAKKNNPPKSKGKLARVSAKTRQAKPSGAGRPARAPDRHANNHRYLGHHQHAPRRPGRSPLRMGLHFGSGYGIPYAPPQSTYVYEEYFYDEPIVRAQSVEPVILTDSYVVTEPSSPSNVYPPAPVPAPYVEPPVVVDEYAAPAATAIETPIATMLKPWNVRLGIEYVGDTDGDVSQFGFDFLANATGGLGIDTDIRTLRETVDGFRDQLWLGDFNIVYELFPSEYIRPRVGIGVNWLADDYGGEAGLNLTVGADMQLLSRVSMTAEADFGTLGDSDFFHANATIGLQQTENVEWYAGYDYVDIGGVTIESVVAGLRFRF